MPTYQTRNPLARTNPLRSIPFLRPAPVARTPEFYAAWELDRASVIRDDSYELHLSLIEDVAGPARRPVGADATPLRPVPRGT